MFNRNNGNRERMYEGATPDTNDTFGRHHVRLAIPPVALAASCVAVAHHAELISITDVSLACITILTF